MPEDGERRCGRMIMVQETIVAFSLPREKTSQKNFERDNDMSEWKKEINKNGNIVFYSIKRFTSVRGN